MHINSETYSSYLDYNNIYFKAYHLQRVDYLLSTVIASMTITTLSLVHGTLSDKTLCNLIYKQNIIISKM